MFLNFKSKVVLTYLTIGCHCTLHNIVLQFADECRDYHTCIHRTTLGSHSEDLQAK